MVALLTVVSVLFATSQATALAPRANVLSDLLVARQTSSIDPSSFPAACRTECTSTINSISACTTVACICSTSNISGLKTCISCVVSTDPAATIVAEGQSVLDTFNSECGVSLTIGSGGSSATTTGASAASSSGSGSSSGSSSSGFQKSPAGKVGLPFTGFVSAGILVGLVTLL